MRSRLRRPRLARKNRSRTRPCVLPGEKAPDPLPEPVNSRRRKNESQGKSANRFDILSGVLQAPTDPERERMKPKPKPNTVDEYIAAAPTEVQPKLKELRALIQKTAAGAEERVSYGMPYYHYKGRLAYFSYWKSHIGLYVPTPVLAEHKHEMAGYETSSATVRFPLHKKLPATLIKTLIKARMSKNEASKNKAARHEHP
jgi:uncharacterized protein YdhG (YjbR/CyaY superfamily)